LTNKRTSHKDILPLFPIHYFYRNEDLVWHFFLPRSFLIPKILIMVSLLKNPENQVVCVLVRQIHHHARHCSLCVCGFFFIFMRMLIHLFAFVCVWKS
jgi:hypothetical protein